MQHPIVVSACLAGEHCRYDGGSNPSLAVIRLVEAGLALSLCPEQLGELPTPRAPCEYRGGKILSRDGEDCTAAFQCGVERALHMTHDAGSTIALLKARSPSCGADGIYDGTFSKRLVSGQGLWANALRQAGLCLYTEEQLDRGICKAPYLPLVTERLLLRQWLSEDKIPFAVLNADPEVMAHFPSPLSAEESDALAERIRAAIAEQGWGLWAVERKIDGMFLGFVGLHRPENLPFSPCIEVGWRLARPFWGMGYATEAARACLEFAQAVLGEARVVAFTARTNTRSQAVMRRLGMEQTDVFEHPALPAGHRLRPHVLFAVPLLAVDGY